MANTGKVKVGIIGSQFQADIHAASLQIMPHEAEVVAVASPTPVSAQGLIFRSAGPINSSMAGASTAAPVDVGLYARLLAS